MHHYFSETSFKPSESDSTGDIIEHSFLSGVGELEIHIFVLVKNMERIIRRTSKK
jgi:hypothetical protein